MAKTPITPERRREHRAGVVARGRKPPTTKLDLVNALMRANASLSRKAAEAQADAQAADAQVKKPGPTRVRRVVTR